MERVTLPGPAVLPGGVRGEDRCQVAFAEPPERGGVTQRPINPFGSVEGGELDRVGHLHLHPDCPGGAGLDEPHPGAVAEVEERPFRRVRGFRDPVQRARRAGRVVLVADPRVARRGELVAGHLDRSPPFDVGGDHLVAVDADPHLFVGQGVRNRVATPP